MTGADTALEQGPVYPGQKSGRAVCRHVGGEFIVHSDHEEPRGGRAGEAAVREQAPIFGKRRD